MKEEARGKADNLEPVGHSWGSHPEDQFGYTTEEERRKKRGLEDWEMVERMSEPQPGIFAWVRTVAGSIIAGILVFVLTAYGIYFIISHYGLTLLGDH